MIHGSSFSYFIAILVAIFEMNRYTVLWRKRRGSCVSGGMPPLLRCIR